MIGQLNRIKKKINCVESRRSTKRIVTTAHNGQIIVTDRQIGLVQILKILLVNRVLQQLVHSSRNGAKVWPLFGLLLPALSHQFVGRFRCKGRLIKSVAIKDAIKVLLVDQLAGIRIATQAEDLPQQNAE